MQRKQQLEFLSRQLRILGLNRKNLSPMLRSQTGHRCRSFRLLASFQRSSRQLLPPLQLGKRGVGLIRQPRVAGCHALSIYRKRFEPPDAVSNGVVELPALIRVNDVERHQAVDLLRQHGQSLDLIRMWPSSTWPRPGRRRVSASSIF
jgi:hypothetical protein